MVEKKDRFYRVQNFCFVQFLLFFYIEHPHIIHSIFYYFVAASCMLLTCTHTAAYEHPVAQFSIRYCTCAAVIIPLKLHAEELVDREVHKEKALRMGYFFVHVAVTAVKV